MSSIKILDVHRLLRWSVDIKSVLKVDAKLNQSFNTLFYLNTTHYSFHWKEKHAGL